MFCIYLRNNSDLCHLQHKLIGFYNRDEKCLLLDFKRLTNIWNNVVKNKVLIDQTQQLAYRPPPLIVYHNLVPHPIKLTLISQSVAIHRRANS